MKIRILNVARLELDDAIAYYNNERPGLGYEFSSEFKNTILRVVDFPEAWPRISSRLRRCLFNRFPYALLYQVDEIKIQIVAVMHMRRNPGVWQKRVF